MNTMISAIHPGIGRIVGSILLAASTMCAASIPFDVMYQDAPVFMPEAKYKLKYKNGDVDTAEFTSPSTISYHGSFTLAGIDLIDGAIWNATILGLDHAGERSLQVTAVPPGAPSLTFNASRSVSVTKITIGGVEMPLEDQLELTSILSPAQFDNQPITIDWTSQVTFTGPTNLIATGTSYGNKNFTYSLTDAGYSWTSARLTGSYGEPVMPDTAPIPEPGSFALLAGGLTAMVGFAHRFRR